VTICDDFFEIYVPFVPSTEVCRAEECKCATSPYRDLLRGAGQSGIGKGGASHAVSAISDRLHRFNTAKEIVGAVALAATPERVIPLGATGNANVHPVSDNV
jgi:hypothetical protein